MDTTNKVPSGTVTFLFTDIVGSTILWERHPQAMGVALARHDEVLRAAIENNHGYVFKTVGDAFCAAFHTAADAVAATLAAQQSLSCESWPQNAEICVRMAVHTGSAELRNGDYFGQSLNRVARLLSAGHGGQILLSLATEELVRDSLTSDVTLRDLGERRLKDLVRPERIFQVVVHGLPDSFPPLRTLEERANNLPVQLTSFIGREEEVVEVQKHLQNSRLVTLAGAGGAGKTRLALQVAADLIDDFPDGVWLAELAPIADADLAVHTVAHAVNVREETGRPLITTLCEALADRKLLLVLDNCEHLVESCASLTGTLLTSCPHVRILATSREALRVAGEQSYRVPSLALPPAWSSTVESIAQFEAVRLFVDRAGLSSPGFAITSENALPLAQICIRLDGIPLALELAAARSRTLSVDEINRRLDDRFRLLTDGDRTAVPRQKTLRALIDWSYDLLSEQEKCLVRRLAVFANGWTLAAAESVCSGSGIEPFDLLDLLTSLADKSLVVIDTTGQESRYRLLHTVRHYANERLKELDDTEALGERHRVFYGEMVERAKNELKGAKQKAWIHRLEEEHDNVRALLHFCVERPAHFDFGMQVCADLFFFWWVRGYWTEANSWYERLLSASEDQPISLARGAALSAAGSLKLYQGDYSAAQALIEAGLRVHETLQDPLAVAQSLHNLAHVAHLTGDVHAAKPLYEESLALRRDQQDHAGMSGTLNNLANLHQEMGNFEEARRIHEENLDLRRSFGSSQGIGQTLQNLGCLAIEMGEYPRAIELFKEALEQVREIGDVRSISEILHAFAEIASKTGEPRVATRIWGSADALRESIGMPIHALSRQELEDDYARVRAELGDEVFHEEWTKGRETSMVEACNYALREV